MNDFTIIISLSFFCLLYIWFILITFVKRLIPKTIRNEIDDDKIREEWIKNPVKLLEYLVVSLLISVIVSVIFWAILNFLIIIIQMWKLFLGIGIIFSTLYGAFKLLQFLILNSIKTK